MGQRLVFKCIKNGEMFATLYYHWSAYTESTYAKAVYLINGLMEHGYNKDMSINDIRIMLLKIVREDLYHDTFFGNDEWQHGGCSRDSLEEFEKIGAPAELRNMGSVTRNRGLINITESGMEYAIFWADTEPEILNFDDETVTNYTLAQYDKDDLQFKECYEEEWAKIYEGLPRFDPVAKYVGEIKWEDVQSAHDWFKTVDNDKWIIGVDLHGYVWTQIC